MGLGFERVWGCRDLGGFRVSGSRGLGFYCLGGLRFRVLGFRGLGFLGIRVLIGFRDQGVRGSGV